MRQIGWISYENIIASAQLFRMKIVCSVLRDLFRQSLIHVIVSPWGEFQLKLVCSGKLINSSISQNMLPRALTIKFSKWFNISLSVVLRRKLTLNWVEFKYSLQTFTSNWIIFSRHLELMKYFWNHREWNVVRLNQYRRKFWIFFVS